MKDKALNILKVIGGLFVVVVAVYFLYARPAYTWEKKILSDVDKDEWELVQSYKSGSLVAPWTIFYPPVTTMVFAHREDVNQLTDDIIVGRVMSFTNTEDGTVHDEFVELFNCKSEKGLILDNDGLNKIDFNDKNWLTKIDEEWFDLPESSGLLKHFCSLLSDIIVSTDIFGNEVDISEFVNSGAYSIKSEYDGYVTALVNKYPYILTSKDEQILKIALDEWIDSSSFNTEVKLPENLLDKCTYDESFIYSVRPVDMFVFRFTPSTGLGEIDIYFSFSRQMQLEPSEELGEVVIHSDYIEDTSNY